MENLTKEPTVEEVQRAYKEALFINEGSVWDIECHTRNAGSKYSLKQLNEELVRESITRNRSTVKKIINVLIRKAEKGVKHA